MVACPIRREVQRALAAAYDTAGRVPIVRQTSSSQMLARSLGPLFLTATAWSLQCRESVHIGFQRAATSHNLRTRAQHASWVRKWRALSRKRIIKAKLKRTVLTRTRNVHLTGGGGSGPPADPQADFSLFFPCTWQFSHWTCVLHHFQFFFLCFQLVLLCWLERTVSFTVFVSGVQQ